MFRPGDRSRSSTSTCPPGVTLDAAAARRFELIRDLNEATLDAGRRRVRGPRSAPTTWPSRCRPRRPRSSTSRSEPQETLDLYGVGNEPTDDYGRRCLLARRLVEKGVRFVCVVSGGGPGNMQWDAHDDIEENHLRMAARDRPAGRRRCSRT